MRFARRLLGSRWLRVGFGALAIAFICVAVINQWGRIGPELHLINASSLVIGMVCVLGGLFTTLMCWRALMIDLGCRLSIPAVA